MVYFGLSEMPGFASSPVEVCRSLNDVNFGAVGFVVL